MKDAGERSLLIMKEMGGWGAKPYGAAGRTLFRWGVIFRRKWVNLVNSFGVNSERNDLNLGGLMDRILVLSLVLSLVEKNFSWWCSWCYHLLGGPAGLPKSMDQWINGSMNQCLECKRMIINYLMFELFMLFLLDV